MNPPNIPLDNLVKQREMESAQEYTKKVRSQLVEESTASHKIYETFHTNLALFSSGTLALSITYLGYLKSSGAHVIGIRFLVASWTCLLFTIPLSLFVSFLHSHHLSYGRMREYQDALSTQKQAEADAVMTLPLAKMTLEEIPAKRDQIQERAQKHGAAARKAQQKEKLYYRLWRVDGFISRALFVLGLAFLYVFAVRNALQ